MSKPEKPNTQPELDEKVQEKMADLATENLAFVELLKDPDFRNALIQRQAAEAEASRAGQLRGTAARMVRGAGDTTYDEYPWGLDQYLEGQYSLEATYDRLAEQKNTQKETTNSDPERDDRLDLEMNAARHLTLQLAKFATQKLRAQGIAPDIEVRTRHTRPVQKFSKDESRRQGKIRAAVDEVNFHPVNEGWKLPISGQVEAHAVVTLCKDGRILVAYGNYKEGGDGAKDKLDVQPNQPTQMGNPGLIPVPKLSDKIRVGAKTYSRYISEELGSDIGMLIPNVSSSISKAHIVLERERAMQEAVISLLVDHNIPLASDPKTDSTLELPVSSSEE
jgi:hypothetical protein